MKKFILLISFSLCFVLGGYAQSAGFGKFNLGLDAALPLYNMRQIFEPGIGGSLYYEYNLSNNISYLQGKSYFANKIYITLGGGYESFTVKTVLETPYTPSTYSYIPVKIGLKYYAIWGLYAEGKYGKSIYAQHGGGKADDHSYGIGYSFGGGFELGARFEKWRQIPQKHVMGDYGQTGPFAKASDFDQFAIRLSERF